MKTHKTENKINLTSAAVGGCIVSVGVLMMLLDGGVHVVFSCIAGTSAVLIHNMAVDDLPSDIREQYDSEIRTLINNDKALLVAAGVLSGIAVIVNPYVGIAGLAASLLFHSWMKEVRNKELYEEIKEMGLADALA